ncbi:MAG: hypothetical protein ACFFF4_04745 [Candidatus Thorarchaeota archaeon]
MPGQNELIFSVNTAALVEALYDMGINQDIVTNIVAGRYSELRAIAYKQLADKIEGGGAQMQQMPSDIPTLAKIFTSMGGFGITSSVENATESGYTLVVSECMFSSTKDILMERHPDSPPPCFISAIFAGIMSEATGKQATIDPVEVSGGKCKFTTTFE